jgi:hypothetical protein
VHLDTEPACLTCAYSSKKTKAEFGPGDLKPCSNGSVMKSHAARTY